MIQRIQSVYLLITAVLIGIMCFLPYGEFLKGAEVFELSVWGIKTTGANSHVIAATTPMGILTILAALLPLVTIFLYKKRFLQIRLCIVEIVLLIGLVIYVGMFVYRGWSSVADKFVFSVIDLFPILGIILCILAYKGIVRDITLIKSLDRIR